MKFTETRTLSMSDLRNLCIKNNWYTNGNNDEYNELLTSVKNKNITTNDIIDIANDIINHSDLNFTIETLENVCFEILEIAHSFIEIN